MVERNIKSVYEHLRKVVALGPETLGHYGLDPTSPEKKRSAAV
jgi:hypothetical protein